MSERGFQPEDPEAHRDRAARNELVEENWGLVKWRSKTYGPWAGELGYERDDLIQDGSFGLIRAAELFQPERGNFSTYAVGWINQSMRRGIFKQARTIRLPIHVEDQFRKSNQTQDKLAPQRGCYPDLAEVAQQIGADKDKLRHAIFMEQAPSSLDQDVELADGETVAVSELTAERTEAGPLERVVDEEEQRLAIEGITEALELLREDEREVIVLRYRLDGSEGEKLRTLREVGKIRGHSREHAHYLEIRALYRIRRALTGRPVPEASPRRTSEGNPEEAADVLTAVSALTGTASQEIAGPKPPGRIRDTIHEARQIAAVVLREKLHWNNNLIAETLGYRSPNTVSTLITKALDKRRYNREFANLLSAATEAYQMERAVKRSQAGELPQ